MSILIIGIGNKYRSDDAVGLRIAESIRNLDLHNCTVVTSSGEGIALINLWERFEHVILIDAVRAGAQPGIVFCKDLIKEPLNSNWFQASSHLFSIPEAVLLAEQLEKLPSKLYFFGIEGKSFDYGELISDEVNNSQNELISQLINTVNQINDNFRDRSKEKIKR